MNLLQTCTHSISRWRACTLMPVSSFRSIHNWRGNCLFFSDVSPKKVHAGWRQCSLGIRRGQQAPFPGHGEQAVAPRGGQESHATFVAIDEEPVGARLWGHGQEGEEEGGEEEEEGGPHPAAAGFRPIQLHLHHNHTNTLHLHNDITQTSHTPSTTPTTTHNLHIHIHTRRLHTDRRYGDGGRRGGHPPLLPCNSVQAGGCCHPDSASTIPQTLTFYLINETY